MDEGLVHPCHELDESPEHRVLAWLSRQANQETGLVKWIRPDKVTFRVRSEVLGATKAAFTHLVDGRWIDKEEHGTSFRWMVLPSRSCLCPGSTRGENRLSAACGAASEILCPQGIGSKRAVLLSDSSGLLTSSDSLDSNTNGVKSESAQKPMDRLVRDFPRLVREAGIQMTPLQAEDCFAVLGNNLRKWHCDLDVSINDIRLMMEEFIRHPEWCRRSQRSPWQVFLSRRLQLAGLIAYNKRQHPGNRRFVTDDEHWQQYQPHRRNFSLT
jgi:hypothetical protein